MTEKKLWGGRFQEFGTAEMDAFGASITFDLAMAQEDVVASLAHVKMLGQTGIIEAAEAQQIQGGLAEILADLQAGIFAYDLSHEDIHMNVEQALYQKIGEVAGKLHTARSRNDQVATDMHLYLKKQVQMILVQLAQLQTVLVVKASENIQTIMPGYTHLQHAQPISFAHHLLAYHEMLVRDSERFTANLQHIDISPLGAAALAGTTFPIDRQLTADLLDFSAVYQNSLDAVSDRDFILEFLSNASILMMHLSRFCEEIILWCSHEYQFVSLSDAYSTGSSIMPQKKNPDYAELIRGKTGRVYGDLLGLLTLMKGLPLAYNKDLQEDKEGMFDAVTTITQSLPIMTGMVETMEVHAQQMKEATQKDFSNATELADYLARKGLPFREAHAIVGQLVYDCLQKGIYLQDVSLTDFQNYSPLIGADIYHELESETAIARRTSIGGTAFSEIEKRVSELKK